MSSSALSQADCLIYRDHEFIRRALCASVCFEVTLNTLLLLVNFIIAVVLALLSNVVANYLQNRYRLLTDKRRIGLVITIFLLAVIAGAILTIISNRAVEPTAVLGISFGLIIAVITLALAARACLRLITHRKAKPIEKPGIDSKAEKVPGSSSYDNRLTTIVDEKLTITNSEDNRLTTIVYEMLVITRAYSEETEEALSPNSLDDFLSVQPPPWVPERQLEWWETVIKAGKGPRGAPVTFLRDYRALRDLSIRLEAVASVQARPRFDQVVSLVELIHKQCADFATSHDPVTFRQDHLRAHIKTVLDLELRLSKLCRAEARSPGEFR